ncbi:MAG: glycerol-3-phosphate acyltransferase [Dehalococcoidales bacterium]|jgi:glycerol-3-phosphate acyltransferase PlsY
MDTTNTVLLAIGAFLLGAVPFSVLIGRGLMRKDITTYGDGNPGAANVFRAGSIKMGLLAVLMDVAKGVPMVLIASEVCHLPGISLALIGTSAVLGHAFSPFLKMRGGKAISVTFGVLLAMPQRDILLVFIIFMLIGFMVLNTDSWIPVLGSTGTSVYLFLTDGRSWSLLLMLCILGIFIIKHFESLRTLPGWNGRLLRWVQSRNH